MIGYLCMVTILLEVRVTSYERAFMYGNNPSRGKGDLIWEGIMYGNNPSRGKGDLIWEGIYVW